LSEEKASKDKDSLRELKAIKNLLIVQLLKSGATSEEIDLATGMGAGNVRTKFSKVKPYPGVTKKGKS
jgi:hypothetical protein